MRLRSKASDLTLVPLIDWQYCQDTAVNGDCLHKAPVSLQLWLYSKTGSFARTLALQWTVAAAYVRTLSAFYTVQ